MNVTIDMYATHVCNSSEGTKVSFMLREIIYGKSPIFKNHVWIVVV